LCVIIYYSAYKYNKQIFWISFRLYVFDSFSMFSSCVRWFHKVHEAFNPYVAIGGGYFTPPRRTFYSVALKPLGIGTKAFVTFPEYMWAKMLKNVLDISTSISNMAAEKWTSN